MHGSESDAGSIDTVGAIAIDRRTAVATVGGATLPLGAKVIATLLALNDRRGEVVAKADLLARVWGDMPVDESSLWQNVHVVRRALAEHAPHARIETVKGRGYRLVVEAIAAAPDLETPPLLQRRRMPGWAWSMVGAAAAAFALQVVHGAPHALESRSRLLVLRSNGSLPALPPLAAGQRVIVLRESASVPQ